MSNFLVCPYTPEGELSRESGVKRSKFSPFCGVIPLRGYGGKLEIMNLLKIQKNLSLFIPHS